MIIYGINPVKEAIRSEIKVKEIFLAERRDARVKEIMRLAARSDIKITDKERGFFRDLKFHSAQYVAADIDFKHVPFEKLVAGHKEGRGVYLVLDLIEDPRNFGAIIRNAAASGVDGIVVQSHRSCRVTPVVFFASSGMAAHMNISEIANIKNAIRVFKDEGFRIVGADSNGAKELWDADFTPPTVIVLGSEGKGIRKTVGKNCDVIVRIPMQGPVSSLNVSVASGVLLYELLRQRRSNKQFVG